MEIRTVIELITPDRAREIIELNSINRAIIKRNLKMLCISIKNGKWQMNGDSIRISETNVLLDGQHRLLAIIETGISCESLLISGLPDKVFTTIDQGTPRTLGHILSSKKVKNYTSAASVVNLLIQYKRNETPRRSGRHLLTKEELLDFFMQIERSLITQQILLRKTRFSAHGFLHRISE